MSLLLGLLAGGPPEAAIRTGYQTTEGSPTITSIATGSLSLPLKVKYDRYTTVLSLKTEGFKLCLSTRFN